MADQVIIALVTILAFTVGAFVWSLVKRFNETRKHPERQDQIRETARVYSQWINEGRHTDLIDDNGEVIDIVRNGEALEKWSKQAPFTEEVHSETLADGERKRLICWFWVVFSYLVLVALIVGSMLFNISRSGTPSQIAVCILGGLFGSTLAAFRSCLDRRANGLEDRWGNRAPEPSIMKERFGDGMVSWFLGRPLLGAAVGFLLFFSLEGDVFPEAITSEVFTGSIGRLAFYMILTGLFAKSLLDLFLDVIKNVFRV